VARFHLKKAMENDLTKDQIVATITHPAFYAGWPPAMTALTSCAARQARPPDLTDHAHAAAVWHGTPPGTLRSAVSIG